MARTNRVTQFGKIKNGGFEIAPPFTAAQTASNFINGTAAGSANNDFYRWLGGGLAATRTVQFDNSIARTGSYSLKLSQGGTSGAFGINTSCAYIATTTTPKGFTLIPVSPNTPYVVSAWIYQTGYVAGGGAAVQIWQYNALTSTSYNGNYNQGNLVTTNLEWTESTKSFTTNAATNAVAVLVSFTCSNAGSTCNIDDVTLYPLSRTTAAARTSAAARVAVS